jgi:hypothetical protein
MSANAQANYLSPAERVEREALLRSLGVSFAKFGAEVIDHPARRRPLGLAPAPRGDDGPERDVAAYGEPDLDRGPVIDITARARNFSMRPRIIGSSIFA